MQTGATHAELMVIAGRHLRIAQAQLASDGIVTRDDALAAEAMFRELVHALGSHARVLVGPRDRMRWVLDSSRPDPVALTAARFSKTLTDAVPRRPRQPELMSAGSLASHFKSSAIAVRTATDLVLTHREPGNVRRVPDSELLSDPRAQVMILDDVAHLAIELAGERQALHQQIQPYRVHRISTVGLPELAAVRDTARDVRTVAETLRRRDAQLARVPELRVGPTAGGPVAQIPTPSQELLDGMRRLHAHAWLIATGPEVPQTSIKALADMAAVAVAVDTQAAAMGARIAGIDVRDPAAPAAVRQYLGKAAAWRDTRDSLTTLQTTIPHSQAVTNETRAIAQALRELIDAQAAPDVQVRLTSYAALRSASGLLDQVADWNAVTLTRLARAGAVYQQGRTLTGAQVTDAPELVAAKLGNKLVPAPKESVEHLVRQYAAAKSGAAPTPMLKQPARQQLPPQPMI